VRATRFEFEQRFWIIALIYFIGFALSGVDHVRFIPASRHLIAPSLAAGSAEARTFSRIVIAVGALLVFVSAVLRTWATAYLRTDVVHDTVQHSEALVADGPFRHTRNPLYLANLPIAVGIGVLASRLGFFFLIVANWLFVYRLIFREEAALRQSQGTSYLAYSEAVPRFWPSVTPRVAAGGRTPRWSQAFLGESFVWLFGAGEAFAAISLNLELAGIVFLIAFLGYFLGVRLAPKAN